MVEQATDVGVFWRRADSWASLFVQLCLCYFCPLIPRCHACFFFSLLRETCKTAIKRGSSYTEERMVTRR